MDYIKARLDLEEKVTAFEEDMNNLFDRADRATTLAQESIDRAIKAQKPE